jgi:hypothetical protein
VNSYAVFAHALLQQAK